MKIKLSRKTVIISYSIIILMFVVFIIFNLDIYKPNFDINIFNAYERKRLNFVENRKYIFMEPKDNKDINKGIIFYPEGLVDERAYFPLLTELSKEGYGVYIIKSPLKLPILNKNSAKVILLNGKYKDYTLMGHSLGGSALFKYLSKGGEESKKISSIVLLSSYNDGSYNFDLSHNNKYNKKVLSIVGTNDKVINSKNYESDKIYLPKNTKYLYLQGGNHSYFGNYGKQYKDGEATVTIEHQQYFVLSEVKKFLNNIS